MRPVDDIEAEANAVHVAARFIPGTYTAPGGVGVATSIDIDRATESLDDRGIVRQDRCEISVLVAEVGAGQRGATVDTGLPGDVWRLMEPIGNDGHESRWLAVRA